MDSDDENGIYSVTLSTSIRNFKSQTSGPSIGAFTCNCISVIDFKVKLFDFIQPHIKREVLFDDDLTPTWSENAEPVLEDLVKFVSFCNKTQKRTFSLEVIRTRHFVMWAEEPSNDICVHIYVYSNNVQNQRMWTIVDKQLIQHQSRDRTNAASTSTLLDTVHQLKTIHEANYMSSDINWMVWANYINSKEAHEQQMLMNRGPPADLIHLFAHARTNSHHQLALLHQNINVGREINSDAVTTVAAMKDALNELKESHARTSSLLSLFETHVNALEQRSSARVGIINAFETAAAPFEHPFGRDLHQQIVDANDEDHEDDLEEEHLDTED